MPQEVMLPAVLKRLAAAARSAARPTSSGEAAMAAVRIASELPGRSVADRKAEMQSSSTPEPPERMVAMVSIKDCLGEKWWLSTVPMQGRINAAPRACRRDPCAPAASGK